MSPTTTETTTNEEETHMPATKTVHPLATSLIERPDNLTAEQLEDVLEVVLLVARGAETSTEVRSYDPNSYLAPIRLRQHRVVLRSVSVTEDVLEYAEDTIATHVVTVAGVDYADPAASGELFPSAGEHPDVKLLRQYGSALPKKHPSYSAEELFGSGPTSGSVQVVGVTRKRGEQGATSSGLRVHDWRRTLRITIA